MTMVRFSLAALAVALFTTTGALAQDKSNTGKGGAAADKGTGGGDAHSSVWGKIVKVDTAKRTLVLGDVMRQGGKTTTGGGTGKGTTGGTGKGTTGGTGDKGTTGGTGGTGATGDKGTTGTGGSAGNLTFTIAETAKVTLDGNESSLRELKEGYFARVQMERSGSTGKGGTSGAGGTGGTSGTGGTAGNKGATGSDKGAGAGRDGDRMRTATKVEAYTKRPNDFGTFQGGTGTGKTGTGIGGKDRDR